MRLLILLITASVIVSSCSIQKRSFRSGYYISWNKSLKEKSASTGRIPIKTEDLSESVTEKDSVRIDEGYTSPQTHAIAEKKDSLEISEELSQNDSPEEKTDDQYSEKPLLKRLGDVSESVADPEKQDISEETSGRKLNIFSLVSLVFSMGYVVLLFSALSATGQMVTLAIAGIFICAILAIILAIIGLVKWGRDRYGFWGTFFSIIALGLLVLGLFAFLFFVIATLSFG